jgi:hypothetical protein
MFLREALLRCSQLEDEVASVYAGLAGCGAATSDAAAAWAEAARKERQRARLLYALAELTAVLDDDGPFLVQAPVQLANLRRVVDNVRGHLASTVDACTAMRCAEALEATQRSELHAGLLEVAEPEVRRVLKLIDLETGNAHRADGDGAKPRGSARSRGSCAHSAS